MRTTFESQHRLGGVVSVNPDGPDGLVDVSCVSALGPSAAVVLTKETAAAVATALASAARPCRWHSGDAWALNDSRTTRFAVDRGSPGLWLVRRFFPNGSYSYVAEYMTRAAARAEVDRLNALLAEARETQPSTTRRDA